MKLTEREKWLMQQAWDASDTCHEMGYTMTDMLNEDTGFNGANTEMLLAHDAPKYKSIVKKVDADNLPEGEVLVLYGSEFILGVFCLNFKGDLIIVDEYDEIYHLDGCKHYIEQKDLIELITGAGE